MKKKRKLGRKLLSFLLTLAMVLGTLGVMPGMSLTVYADGAYSSYVVTDSDSGEDLWNKEVNFNGLTWYIIKDESTAVNEGTVTLFAKEPIGQSVFNSNKENNHYSSSAVKEYLDSLTAEGSSFAGVADAIMTIDSLTTAAFDSTDVYDTAENVKLYLLDIAEATNIPDKVRYNTGYQWWLRSPGGVDTISGDDTQRARVVEYHNIPEIGYFVNSELSVRPALKLDLSKVNFSNKTFSLKPAATEYPLWVGGVQVTSANADNIDGSNKASYNAETKTLTLNGYNNNDSVYSWTNAGEQSCSAAIYAEEDLIIELSGTNTVNNNGTGMEDYGIYALNALTIKGSGQLNTNGGFGIYAFNTLDINSGVINATSTAENGAGISILQGLNVTDGTVTATGEFQGINSQKDITINGGTVTATGGHDGIFVATSYTSTISMTVEGGTVDATGGTSGIHAGDLTIKNGSSVTATCNDDSYCFAIIGKESNATSAGYVNNEIAGTGWTNKAGTEGQTTIAANSKQVLTPYKKVKFPAAHNHNFTYTLSADGTTITATCSEEGCDLPTDGDKHVATLKIAATGGAYDGTTAYGVTITDENSIQGTTTVSYYKANDAGTGKTGDPLTEAPKNAGKYWAEITLGTGDNACTAHVVYEVAKAETTITTDPTASDITYGQKLENSVLTGGTASVTGTFAWKDKTTAPVVADSQSAEYDVVFNPTDSDNYKTAECKVKLTVNPKEVGLTWTNTNLTYNGQEQTPTATATGLESGDEGKVNVTVTGGQTNARTEAYTATASGLTGDKAGNYKLQDETTASFTISPKSITEAVVTLDSTQLTYNGSEQSVSVATVSLDGVTLTADDYTVSGNTGINKDGYTVTVTGKGNYKNVATADWKIVAKAMTVTAEPVSKTYDGNEYDITVNVTEPSSGTTVMYGTEAGTYNLDASPKFKDAGMHTVYFKVSGNDDYSDYEGSATVTISKKAVTANVSAEDKPYDGKTDATVTASVPTEALVSGDSIEITGIKGNFVDANVGAGKKVTVDSSAKSISGTGSDNYEVTIPAETTASISKSEPKVTAPAPKTLTYNGQAQELVSAGEATGGTLYYAVTTENKAPTDESLYTTDIPTKNDAGIYYVWYKVVGDENHENYIALSPVSVKIEQATVNLTWENTEFTYDGTEKLPTAEITAGIVGEDVCTVEVSGEETTVNTGDSTYTATAKLTGKDSANYKIADADLTITFTISAKAMKVTADGVDVTYDGKEHKISVNVTDPEDATITYKKAGDTEYSATNPTFTDAGEYEVSYKVTKANYNEFTGMATVKIKKKMVVVSGITAANKEYDETTNATLVYSGAAFDGKVGIDTLTVTATGSFADANAGEGKKVTINGLTLGGESVKNYELAATGNQTETKANITKKEVVVTPDADQSKIYGETEPSYKYSADGLVGTETLDGALAREQGNDAGTYAYTIGTLDSENSNYSVTLSGASPKFEVKAKEIEIKWANTELTYNGKEQAPEASIKNKELVLVGDDEVNVTVSGQKKDVNTADTTYIATASVDNKNYTLKESTASTAFTIKKAELTVTADAKNIVYGDKDIPLTYSVDGLTGNDKPEDVLTGALTREAGTDAGTYKIKQGTLDSDSYAITFTGADYVIAKKSVKVSGITASNKVYDGTNEATVSTDNAVFGGKVGTDTLTVTAKGSFEDGNVGEGKKVTISGLTLGGASVKNYELATTGNQTETIADITKKAVVVTPDADQSKVYGAADPVFTYKATGLVGDEELSGALARTKGETVGEYAYTIGTLDLENANYNVSIAESAPKFEIKKAALTVTAEAKNITYGDEDVPLTYKVSGLAEGDTADKVLTGALTRETGTDAGTYKIEQGSLTSADYSITFVGADYVIVKAAQAAPVESFTTSKATGSDTSDGTISGFAAAKAYQISSDNGATWTDVKASSTSLDVKAGDYQIRYVGDKNHEAGASVSVTVGKKADQSKPEGLETENVSAENATDGVVTGVTDAMEYSTDDGKTWTAVPTNADKIDGLAAGEVLVRYAETDDKNASPYVTVAIGVASKTEGVVEFKPEEGTTDVEEKAITGVDNESTKASVDDFAETQQEEGKDVKVALEITPQKEENVDKESVEETNKVVEEVFAGIDSEKVVTEYLAIDVAKYVDNVKETENISDTKTPLEIALKFDSKKSNPVVVRTHDGKAKAFGKLRSRPAKKDYKDAMFYIDLENAILYIYSQYFSDFAIVYATETTYNVGFVSGTGVNLSPLVVAEGGKVTLPTGLKNDGYAFDGWYQDEAYKTAWKDSDTVNADITLYAKWNKSVSGVSVSPSEVKFTKAGETSQIKTTVTPADAANTKVTYKSSDTKVATVDANGKITAVANGTATITVTTEDGAKTATVKVTVSIPEVKQQGTEEPVQQPTKEEKAVISMNAGLKISQTGSKINIKWGKVGEADGYDVYVAYCGKKFGKAVKTINKNSTTSVTVKKINGKKINLKKNFKVYVAAYKMTDGKKEILAKTITGHVVGRKNTKYSNAKKITLSKNKYSVKVGKTVKVKAKTVLVDKSKKQLSDAHAAQFRYASSNRNIATVDKNGKVKGVAKGTCTIYVYARNGYAKTVKVTVK